MEIIQRGRKSFGEKINAGLATAAQEAGKYAEQGQLLQREQTENKKIRDLSGLDLQGIRDPETRQRLIADQLIYGRKAKQVKGSQDIDYSLEGLAAGGKLSDSLPEFIGKQSQQQNQTPQEGEPQKQPRQRGVGNAPEPETVGGKKTLLTPDQLLQKGRQISAQSTPDNPITVMQGYQIATDMNNANEKYNAAVEADKKQKVESQRNYGNIFLSKLKDVFENANPELQALAKRHGEEASTELGSEADIERKGAVFARNLKNTISNVKKSLPPKRFVESIKQKLLGTSRDFDKTKNDLRVKLAPLLEEGLYDTSRNLLNELGYHAEEVESVIGDLSESSRKIINQLPKFSPKVNYSGGAQMVNYSGGAQKLSGLIKNIKGSKELLDKGPREYSPQDLQKINTSVRDLFKADPSANLILTRKAYEDKGVDWQAFKDAMNDAILNGGLKLNDDQFSQLDILDNPPLDNLEKILHGLNLIGR